MENLKKEVLNFADTAVEINVKSLNNFKILTAFNIQYLNLTYENKPFELPIYDWERVVNEANQLNGKQKY